MDKSEEAFLLRKLKDGDINALEIIFNRHYSNLCRYLLLLFKNELLVEHIAQDIFVYLWENRQNIEINSSLESYLYSAGRYKAINQIRNAKRKEKINMVLFENQSETDVSPIDVLEMNELEQIIEKAIETLPERCQKIFRLSREEDLSYKEIAVLLDISVNTVENQMAIALKKLRSILRPFYMKMFFTL